MKTTNHADLKSEKSRLLGRRCLCIRAEKNMEVLLIALLLIFLGVLFVHFLNSNNDASGKTKDQTLVEYPVSDWAGKRGQRGEEEVQRILSRLPRTEYVVLNDVLLPTGTGTTQIDHVVVSLYGIFVIESKNYKGSIYGTRTSEKWSQYINGEQYNFRNPLKQNTAHVMAIEKATMISGRYIIPLVVFTGSATLNVLSCDEVIYDGMLYETICRYKEKVLTPDLMESYARIIDDKIDENRDTISAHVDGVRERKTLWDQEINAGKCPRCDGYLVLRKGKYGDFYGCSNYPRCKFTKNL